MGMVYDESVEIKLLMSPHVEATVFGDILELACPSLSFSTFLSVCMYVCMFVHQCTKYIYQN